MANGLHIRQFTVCQFEENPRTGEKIADLAQIAANLEKYKSFTTWAWCIHDRDEYTQDAIDDMRCTLEHEAKAAGLTDEAAIAEYIKIMRGLRLAGRRASTYTLLSVQRVLWLLSR